MTMKPGSPVVIVSERSIALLLVTTLIGLLLVMIALPLWSVIIRSLENTAGDFVGLANFITYLSTPALVQSLGNSIVVSAVTTLIVIPLAFVYAYALVRSSMPCKGVILAVALLPLFSPSLMSAISLIYLFGNQGFMKIVLGEQSIYGPIGIVIGEVSYCFPHALMIIITALRLTDGRLYEVAESFGTSKSRIFLTITLPGVRYGLMSAAFVTFTLVVTDFGIPKVIGGQFNVLATDAYKQIVGQQNFGMGAVVALILLIPAVASFIMDRRIQRKQVALLTSRSVPFTPKRYPVRDRLMLAYCILFGTVLALIQATAIWGSFIQYWPYNLTMTFKHYDFAEFDVGGWQPYFTSLKMATLVAIIGTTVVFTGSYLTEKIKDFAILRSVVHFFAMLPMAVPGLVLGLGYVFFFNAKWNPLNIFYGGLVLLILNTISHFYTVSHITSTTWLKQIDSEFESVSASLKAPFWKTFYRVTLPVSTPVIIDIAVYMFVNALTTVSSVIFLYGPSTKLASIATLHMDEAGATAAAAGMATCILLTAITARVGAVLVDRYLLARLQRWRQR